MRKLRNSHKRAIYFMSFVLVLMIGIGIVQVTSSYDKHEALQAEIAVLEAQKTEENLRAIELKQTINDMNSRAFIEKMARQRFGLIYPDETVIDTSESD